MVQPRCNVCDQGPQHIKGCVIAKLLLKKYLSRDLVDGNMAWSLDYGLNTFFSCAAAKVPERCQFLNLRLVQRVRDRLGPESVTETDDHPVLLADIKHIVVALEEGVLTSVGPHPA